MKSPVVFAFAVVALCVVECSVAGTKFGYFFAHLHLLTSKGTNHHLSLKAKGGGCVRSPWILILSQQNLPDPVELSSILLIPPHWWSVFCSSPFQRL